MGFWLGSAHDTACICSYGDDLAYENSDAYVSEILALVRQQNIHQCSATQGILLEELEFKHMYDACIYFISPHQLKPRDLKFMSSISKVVPVIPVIAKADSMTTDERDKFRAHINSSLANPVVLGRVPAPVRPYPPLPLPCPLHNHPPFSCWHTYPDTLP